MLTLKQCYAADNGRPSARPFEYQIQEQDSGGGSMT